MKDKGFKMGILVAVIAMVVVVGIGYAAFTATLNINGTAKVEASSWNVHFANCTDGNCITTSNIQSTKGIPSTAVVNVEPVLTDTTISDWDVTLKTPGDYVKYTFNVVNDGSFDAKLSSSFALPTPTCTGTGENAETDAANVCKNLTYNISSTGGLGSASALQNLVIAKGESRAFTISLFYKPTATDAELPKGDVTISNLGFTMVYTQA